MVAKNEFDAKIAKLNKYLSAFSTIDKNLSCSISADMLHDYPDCRKPGSTTYDRFSSSISEIYPQTIQTSINAVKELLGYNHVALVGLTQSDKSASQFLSALIFSVSHYLKTGQFCIPLFTCPHSNGKFEGQLKNKFSKLSTIVQYLKIRDKNREFKIKDYFELMQKNVLDKLDTPSQSILHHTQSGGYYHPIRICKAIQNDLSLVIRHLVQRHNCLPIIVRDEVHLNNREQSIEHQTYVENQKDDQVFGNCVDLFNNKQALYMPVSATPWNSLHFKMVKIEINSNIYCGFPQRYKYLDQEVFLDVPKERHPKHTTFEELHPFFRKYPRASVYYRQEDKYYQYVNEESWEKFKERYAKAVYEIINLTYQEKRYTIKGKLINGMLIRSFNNNDVTTELVNQIKKYNKNNYNTNFYCMYKEETNSVEEFINSNNIDLDNITKKNIIFLTGGGRASDSFPAEFGYGLDFTNEASNWTALFQGIIGRLTGYNKNSFIVLSKKNKKLLEAHRDNGWSCQDDGKLRGNKNKNLLIGLKEECRLPKYITASLKELKEECISFKALKDKIKNQNHFGDKSFINIADYLKDEEIQKIVEKINPKCDAVSLKNINKNPEEGMPNQYYPNKHGYVCLSKRTTNDHIGNTNDNRLILRFKKDKFYGISFLVNQKKQQKITAINNGHTAGLINNE